MLNPTISEVGPFEKLLTIQVAEKELEQAKFAAARKLSGDLKIPGFRPGKAPRRVVEATVGPDRLRSEAIDEFLPEAVANALSQLELTPAAAPAIKDIRDIEEGIEIDVNVTMWPTVEEPPTYEDRQIEIESPEVGEEELSEQLDRMLEQFAELETVDRTAADGDFVLIDMSAGQDGTPIEEASASDLLYGLGTGMFVDGMDEHLAGSKAGDIVEFSGSLPDGFGDRAGEAVTFRVLAKEVKEKRLPELTDQWVTDFTEFESVDELRTSMTQRLGEMKRNQGLVEFRTKLLEAMIGDLEIEIPAALVDAEMEEIFHNFAHRLESQNISIEDYLAVSGTDQEGFIDDLRSQATHNISSNVILDAVALQQSIEVADEEYEQLVDAIAAQSEADAEALRRRFAETNQEKALRDDILRRKSLDAILGAAVAVDADGRECDVFGRPENTKIAEQDTQPTTEDDDDV